MSCSSVRNATHEACWHLKYNFKKARKSTYFTCKSMNYLFFLTKNVKCINMQLRLKTS